MNLQQYLGSLRRVESGGNYTARGPLVRTGRYAGERALGAYQVMPGNLPSWSQRYLGRPVSESEFLSSPGLQDQLAGAIAQENYTRYGNWGDVASIWHSGRPLSASGGATDGYMRTHDYARNVVGGIGTSGEVDLTGANGVPYDNFSVSGMNTQQGPFAAQPGQMSDMQGITHNPRSGSSWGQDTSTQGIGRPSRDAVEAADRARSENRNVVLTSTQQITETEKETTKQTLEQEKSLYDSTADAMSDYFKRAVFIIVGLIALAAGLRMFGMPVPGPTSVIPMARAAKGLKKLATAT